MNLQVVMARGVPRVAVSKRVVAKEEEGFVQQEGHFVELKDQYWLTGHYLWLGKEDSFSSF